MTEQSLKAAMKLANRDHMSDPRRRANYLDWRKALDNLDKIVDECSFDGLDTDGDVNDILFDFMDAHILGDVHNCNIWMQLVLKTAKRLDAGIDEDLHDILDI